MKAQWSSFEHIDINDDFKHALTYMSEYTDSLFITGNAGTGKSTLLSYFRAHNSKRMVILAPTGVSALHVKGETIHSFFKFKSNITVSDAIKLGRSIKRTDFLEEIETIIIDEVSMVRADLMDCIDTYLREALKNHLPFGGKQMIFIGDLYQLPPVVTQQEEHYFRDVYASPYFFSSAAISNPDFALRIIELKKIYRQKNETFITLLNAIRTRTITPSQLHDLNQRVIYNYPPHPSSIYLSSTNATAQHINMENLNNLPGKLYSHTATYSAKFDLKMAPTEVSLDLKEGAHVMFVNNNNNGDWVNGTLGKIIEIDESRQEIKVALPTNAIVTVSPHQWQTYKHIYDPDSKTLKQESSGTFTQFPLKLAWAVTIHKSQGKTFSHVVIDLGQRAFANGQVYVALSRCKTLEGITLKRPIRLSDILIDSNVTHFLNQHTHKPIC